MFTLQDLHDALYAEYIQDTLRRGQWSRVYQALLADAAGCTAPAAATPAVVAQLQESYDRGSAILRQAAIWRTPGYDSAAAARAYAQTETAGAVLIEVHEVAGYRLYRGVYLLAGPDPRQCWLTPEEAARRTGYPAGWWRRQAGAGAIPDAFKKGQRWFLPAGVILAASAPIRAQLIERIAHQLNDNMSEMHYDPAGEAQAINRTTGWTVELWVPGSDRTLHYTNLHLTEAELAHAVELAEHWYSHPVN